MVGGRAWLWLWVAFCVGVLGAPLSGGAYYALPSGERCVTCPTLEDEQDRTLRAEHGDCHDCCALTLSTSPSPMGAIEKSGTQFDLVAILDCPLAAAKLSRRVAVRQVHAYLTACPSHAPPRSNTSRAPPTFLNA
jgi:hypothetical protein